MLRRAGLRWLIPPLIAAALLAACGDEEGDSQGTPIPPTFSGSVSATPEEGIMPFFMSMEAFGADQPIPSRFTCDGDDISPELVWTDPPEGTQSFALIMDDPDAGGFTHWVIYNMGSAARGLPEGVEKTDRPSNGATGFQGRNDFGRVGYGGPCPPGGTHHYRFQLYALDGLVELAPGASKQTLVDAMTGHMLATTTLTGRYKRQ